MRDARFSPDRRLAQRSRLENCGRKLPLRPGEVNACAAMTQRRKLAAETQTAGGAFTPPAAGPESFVSGADYSASSLSSTTSASSVSMLSSTSSDTAGTAYPRPHSERLMVAVALKPAVGVPLKGWGER